MKAKRDIIDLGPSIPDSDGPSEFSGPERRLIAGYDRYIKVFKRWVKREGAGFDEQY